MPVSYGSITGYRRTSPVSTGNLLNIEGPAYGLDKNIYAARTAHM